MSYFKFFIHCNYLKKKEAAKSCNKRAKKIVKDKKSVISLLEYMYEYRIKRFLCVAFDTLA